MNAHIHQFQPVAEEVGLGWNFYASLAYIMGVEGMMSTHSDAGLMDRLMSDVDAVTPPSDGRYTHELTRDEQIERRAASVRWYIERGLADHAEGAAGALAHSARE